MKIIDNEILIYECTLKNGQDTYVLRNVPEACHVSTHNNGIIEKLSFSQ